MERYAEDCHAYSFLSMLVIIESGGTINLNVDLTF